MYEKIKNVRKEVNNKNALQNLILRKNIKVNEIRPNKFKGVLWNLPIEVIL